MQSSRIKSILIFLSLIIGMSAFAYIPILLLNIDINKLSDSALITYEFIMDISFMLFIYLIYHKQINNDFIDYFKNFKKLFKIGITYYIIGLIIMVISNNIINIFFSNANASNEEAVRSLIDKFPIYMIFSVSIYAPFVEEIIFRKSIKDIFGKDNEIKITNYLYIITSGLIFALMHIIGSATSSLDYLYIIPYLALGMAFAITYLKTKNIFTSITMHSVHNIIAIILYLVVKLI